MDIRRLAVLFLCAVLAAVFLAPAAVMAEGGEQVVRVGWYETPFNHKDSFGRRTGYAYEYQRKIAAYTGWKYEYVEGNWPELLQMLGDGRIDLMSDVSYVEERAEHMYYSDLPMGTEIYYLYVTPENREISMDDYRTLNGKKIGVTRSTIQKNILVQWMENHGISAEVTETDGSEQESLALMQKGEMDAFITLDSYGNAEAFLPLWKIGSSDFYFAVSRDRPDLLAGLNAAMSRIQDESKNYNEQLSEKYFTNGGTNYYLTADEKGWLENHGKIRVAYQDNYLAFCASDPATGELTGALKDCLALAAGTLDNAAPEFEAVAYPTAAAAIEAVRNGEADCMFPANLTDSDAENQGVLMTAPLMRTEMDAVIRAEDQKDFLLRKQVRVGVNRGNPNYEMFLMDHFPEWTPVFYNDTPECLNEVAAKKADCIIISKYRYTDIARQCKKLHLTTVYTGVDMDYCLAVKEGNTTLYSILSKMIGMIPGSSVNAALNYYSSENEKIGVIDFLLDNHLPAVALAVICAALIVIVLAQQRIINKERGGQKASPRGE